MAIAHTDQRRLALFKLEIRTIEVRARLTLGTDSRSNLGASITSPLVSFDVRVFVVWVTHGSFPFTREQNNGQSKISSEAPVRSGSLGRVTAAARRASQVIAQPLGRDRPEQTRDSEDFRATHCMVPEHL
jgi:hypothetical protein